MVPGTQHPSLSLAQRFQGFVTCSLFNIVNHQILAHDVRVYIGIEVVVRQNGTLSLFVEGKVDAIERAVLITDNIRFLGPCIVTQHIER